MLTLRDPQDAGQVRSEAIRELLVRRFKEVGQGDDFDADVMGEFLVVETGDTVASIEAHGGIYITSSPFNGPRYGEPSFSPCFEVLEEHPCCFEMVFIGGEGDDAVILLIPKADDVDPELFAFCARFAVPTPDLASF